MSYFIFSLQDLEEPYELNKDSLPTQYEVPKYVLSRSSVGSHMQQNYAIKLMCQKVHEISKKGDCCPVSTLQTPAGSRCTP